MICLNTYDIKKYDDDDDHHQYLLLCIICLREHPKFAWYPAFAVCWRPCNVCLQLLSQMVQDCQARRLPNIHDLVTCPGYFWPLWPWLVDIRLIKTAYCKHRSIALGCMDWTGIRPKCWDCLSVGDYTGIPIMACYI